MPISVGLLGGRGQIAQKYRELLENHPWFSLSFIASREGPGKLGDLPDCPLLFSALPNDLAQKFDPFYVEKGYTVISSASCHRLAPQVPLIIPELNFQVEKQPGKGLLIAKPNCSIQSFLLPLGALDPFFGVEKISVTTLQATSGAGKPLPEFQDNVIPYIEDEERKTEQEPCKILGKQIAISAQCNRVSTADGHLASCSVAFSQKPSIEEMKKVWKETKPLPLPSSPKTLFEVFEDPKQPQPRFDLHPMQIQIGRLKECPILHYRFVALSHNTIRGGAGGGILIAEKLKEEGHFG